MIKYLVYKIKKSSFLLFLFKVTILLLIIISLDFATGKILRYYYFKQESGQQYLTTYSLEKTTADLLVFGSSRADHHYHPEVFENRFNLSFYNAGRDNMFMLYHFAILEGVLKRYSPKVIILDIFKGEFKKTQRNYDKLSVLLPYYQSHPEIRPLIELKSPFEKIKLLSSVFPYNSSIFTIAIGNTEMNKKRWPNFNGYVPLDKTWEGQIRTDTVPVIYEIDSTIVTYYEKFIQECKKSNIKLYIVCSPYLINSHFTDSSIETGKTIAKKYNVMFLDYSQDTLFTLNPKLFADIEHLNNNGAKIYSKLLIDSIYKTVQDN